MVNTVRYTTRPMILAACALLLLIGGCNQVKNDINETAESDQEDLGKDNEDGFVQIFDGKTLNNWEGDTAYWSVKDGNLVGQITPEKVLKTNSFIVWRGGTTEDF